MPAPLAGSERAHALKLLLREGVKAARVAHVGRDYVIYYSQDGELRTAFVRLATHGKDGTLLVAKVSSTSPGFPAFEEDYASAI